MNTTLKVRRFRVRRSELAIAVEQGEAAASLTSTPATPAAANDARPVAAAAPATPPEDDGALFAVSDGFSDEFFPPQDGQAPRGAASAAPPATEDELDAIRREGLTGRQMRLARRLAQRHGLNVTSDLDAVRQLRLRGIDPLKRSALLDLLPGSGQSGEPPHAPAEPGRALTTTDQSDPPVPARRAKPGLPDRPAPVRYSEAAAAAELMNLQRDVIRRRRRNTLMLMARLFLFVMLPTFLCGLYYYHYATPLYETRTEFVIQQSHNPTGGGGGGLGSLLSGSPLATSQDSVAVQGYLQSREAMQRLDEDMNFRAHFSGDNIDMLTRLPPDATQEEVYRTYTRNVKIAYDPTEGIIKLTVRATDPQLSAEFSRALIRYAEGQIDALTQRMRDGQMKGAREAYEEAELKMTEAQQRVLRLQETYQIMSSETEVSLITGQIASLEGMLTEDRLSLLQMESNANPNQSRMEPLKRRMATLESEIALLRKKLTEGDADGQSLAVVQAQLQQAQTDLETRRMLLTQSLTSMETARVEANRQTRYLSLSVSPVPPDEPAFPKAFENTVVAGLLFMGIYMLLAMTVAILREQMSA